MNHTPEIKKAIQFAALKHRDHVRRNALAYPYITHLFSVALLVAETGAEDDAVIAALLHDTLEDTDTRPEEIERAFGPRVLALVQAVSEPRGAPWKTRKETYLAQLKNASENALLISLADKIDNTESKIEEFASEGQEFLEKFTQSGDDYLWFHSEVLKVMRERLPDHPLTKRLAEAHTKEQEVLGRL